MKWYQGDSKAVAWCIEFGNVLHLILTQLASDSFSVLYRNESSIVCTCGWEERGWMRQ